VQWVVAERSLGLRSAFQDVTSAKHLAYLHQRLPTCICRNSKIPWSMHIHSIFECIEYRSPPTTVPTPTKQTWRALIIRIISELHFDKSWCCRRVAQASWALILNSVRRVASCCLINWALINGRLQAVHWRFTTPRAIHKCVVMLLALLGQRCLHTLYRFLEMFARGLSSYIPWS